MLIIFISLCDTPSKNMDSSELPPHPLQILQLEITQDSLLKYRPSDDSTYQENDTSSSVPECHAYEYPTSSTDEIRGGETDSGESSLSRALHTLSLEVTSEGVIVNCDSSSTGDVSDHQGVTNHNGTVSRDEECLPSLNKYYGITTPSVSPDKNSEYNRIDDNVVVSFSDYQSLGTWL